MPDENVAVADEIESPEAPEAPTTPPADDSATLKKRLAGKDQALTRIQQERDALAAEAETLRRWKAEREEADLSEFEKLQKRLAEQEARAAAAEAAAERIRLEKSYPLAVEFYGDDPLPNEERLAALQQRLATAAPTGDDEPPEDPHIDPNRPRRSAASAPPKDASIAELRQRLREEAKGFASLEDVPSFGATRWG